MRVYTAHVKPGREAILVREGWSWGAFLFGPLWLLFRGAWIPAAILIAAYVADVGLLVEPARFLVGFGLALLTGLLGRDLRRWSLGWRGFTLAHVVAARDGDAALARLYEADPALLEQAR